MHILDAADEMCPKCGAQLQEFAGQCEEADEVDVIERRFVLVKHKRQKYRCECGCIETAEAPPKLQKSGRYSVGFATAVAVGKYADHLPLQRQVVQMRRQGLRIDSQTLWDQLFALSEHFVPAYEALHQHALTHPVVGADETTWRLMGKKDVTSTKRWQVWALSAPDAVFYQLHPSRSADAAAQLLKDIDGTVMCDGYSAYKALEKRRHDFQLAHCWAHARRKFVEIEETFPKPSEEALGLIGELYRIERDLQEKPPDMRLPIRQQRAGLVVQQIHQWALGQRALPQSPLGKAIAYLGKHWDGLRVFLTDPEVPLDNNRTERAMRGVVVGRENHYGSRSERGTPSRRDDVLARRDGEDQWRRPRALPQARHTRSDRRPADPAPSLARLNASESRAQRFPPSSTCGAASSYKAIRTRAAVRTHRRSLLHSCRHLT